MISDSQPPLGRPAPSGQPGPAAQTGHARTGQTTRTGQTAAAEGSYVDWATILAGAVFAMALSFLLISFGAGLGLSLSSPYRGEGVSASWLAIAAGIWFAWVVVTGFGAGGYLAGRLRRRAGDATEAEVTARDGMHGLMVWATGALAGTILAAMGLGGLAGAGASALGSAAGSAAGSVADMAEGDGAGDGAGTGAASDYFAHVMLRGADSAGDAGGTGTGTDIDPAIQQQIATLLARAATRGEMLERDRNHLARLVAANTDLDQNAARDRVDEVNAEIDEARARARDAAERARIAGVIAGFVAAATLLTGALAAFFAAAAGGRHRDDGLGLDIFTPRR